MGPTPAFLFAKTTLKCTLTKSQDSAATYVFFVSGPLVVGHNQSYSTSVKYNCFATEKPSSRKHQYSYPLFKGKPEGTRGFRFSFVSLSKLSHLCQREHNEKNQKNYGEHLNTSSGFSLCTLLDRKKMQIMLTRRIFQCNHRNYCECGYLVQFIQKFNN